MAVMRPALGTILDDSQASLEDMLKVVAGQKTCLLCFERDPKTCHRSIIAQSIVCRGHESFELYGDDPTIRTAR